MLGQQQLPTLSYNPQANGATERMIGTIFLAVKKYSKIAGNQDWDDMAERLAWAINTSMEPIRKDTPFYLVHGWDAQTTPQSSLPTLKTSEEREAWRWRLQIQQDHQYSLTMAKDVIQAAQQARSDAQNERVVEPNRILPGDLVWMYVK